VPERLDRVTIVVSWGTVEIPWSSRDALLKEIRPRDNGEPVVRAFEGAGAARPVELEPAGKLLVVQAIDLMLGDASGAEHLPEGLFQLQSALIDDLRDTAG
jgi:hypothetical protein